MISNLKHLGNINSISTYKVRLEFTKQEDPSNISKSGLPFVSTQTEIEANSLTTKARSIHKQYGRIPYSSPLYIWEISKENTNKILYIGQTMLQRIQDRFEGHSNIVKLLAKYVNNQNSRIFYRLCSRLDLIYIKNGYEERIAIEHLPLGQARKVVHDIEAWLIFKYKPKYNTRYVNKEKKYWKKFSIDKIVMRN